MFTRVENGVLFIMNDIASMVAQAYAGVETTSISELCEQYLRYTKARRSKATTSTRTTHINQLLAFLTENGIDDITKLNNQVIELYLGEYRTTHKLSTVSGAQQIIKSFITWVTQYKEIDTRVKTAAISRVKPPRSLPKYIDDKVIESVLYSPQIAPKVRLMVMLMYRAGLRIGEMANVKMSDIDGDMLHVIGKGNIERVVYLPKSLKTYIDMYAALYLIGEDEYLITSRDGKMASSTAWKNIKDAFTLVAQYKMNPHQLRHSYAMYLLLNGCDIVTIQRSLGHTDLKTTQVYLNISDDLMRSQIQKVLG